MKNDDKLIGLSISLQVVVHFQQHYNNQKDEPLEDAPPEQNHIRYKVRSTADDSKLFKMKRSATTHISLKPQEKPQKHVQVRPSPQKHRFPRSGWDR